MYYFGTDLGVFGGLYYSLSSPLDALYRRDLLLAWSTELPDSLSPRSGFSSVQLWLSWGSNSDERPALLFRLAEPLRGNKLVLRLGLLPDVDWGGWFLWLAEGCSAGCIARPKIIQIIRSLIMISNFVKLKGANTSVSIIWVKIRVLIDDDSIISKSWTFFIFILSGLKTNSYI